MAAAGRRRAPPTAHARRCRPARRRIGLRRRHSGCRARPWSWTTDRRGAGGERLVLAMPMPRDVETRRDPYPVAHGEIVEEAREAGGAARPPDQPAMQADRHHLGRVLAFGV